jgi:hypothetical protein
MPRYRWTTPTRKGRWHPTRRAAAAAAERAKLASRDPHTGNLFLDVFTEIEADEAP